MSLSTTHLSRLSRAGRLCRAGRLPAGAATVVAWCFLALLAPATGSPTLWAQQAAPSADLPGAAEAAARATEPAVPAEPKAQSQRAAYMIDVPLPLMGTRDEVIQRQIHQIAAKTRGDQQRPVVILRFAAQISDDAPEKAAAGKSRGSQFERALALARFLTSPAAAKVRLIAYLPESVEGHAVLPVLACEEIIALDTAELGRAAIDEAVVDETVRGAYKDIVRRRGTLSEAVVEAMLDPNVEVVKIELGDGDSRIVTQAEAKELSDDGKVIIRGDNVWSGGGLASFSGDQMRRLGWVSHAIENEEALAAALNITGRLQSVRLQPEQWKAARVEITQKLDADRVNQIIRSIGERKAKEDINLLVLQLGNAEAPFAEALRLALYIAELESDGITTAAFIEESCATPAVLPALACDQVFILKSASLGSPDLKGGAVLRLSAGSQQSLVELENLTGRPASFMTAVFDPDSIVKLYVHQESGKRLPLAEWQLKLMNDQDKWLAREQLTSGGEIDTQVALDYGVVDSEVSDHAAALHELGLTEEAPVVEGPWLENVIQKILAREWLPRLLVVLGFMALMIEMGSPGLGVGGFVAALCFLGFFWIEGLNGNVAWLEVLLFVGGMVSLAIELFVLPGFGLFGIGGILMVLSSIVLASQTFVLPSNSEQLTIIANNLFWVAISALVVLIGLVMMGKRLENTPVLRWVTIEPAGIDDVAELEQREAIVHWEHLLGQDGLTTTRCNPAGKAQFGRMVVNVLGTHLIDEGVPVRVVEVRGNSVFVEPLE